MANLSARARGCVVWEGMGASGFGCRKMRPTAGLRTLAPVTICPGSRHATRLQAVAAFAEKLSVYGEDPSFYAEVASLRRQVAAESGASGADVLVKDPQRTRGRRTRHMASSLRRTKTDSGDRDSP